MTGIKISTARGNAQAMSRVFQDLHMYGMAVPLLHADGTIQRIDPRVFVEMMKQTQCDPDAADPDKVIAKDATREEAEKAIAADWRAKV